MPLKCKIARAKYAREKYLKNIEKIKIYSKQYHLKNRSKQIAKAIKWDQDNRERANKRVREWAKKYPEKRKSTYLKNTRGITLEDYNKILQSQNNGCAICGALEPGSKKKWFCVDHCHTTDENRGLLCDRCNKGLGHFRDNVDFLEKAIKYLHEHR